MIGRIYFIACYFIKIELISLQLYAQILEEV